MKKEKYSPQPGRFAWNELVTKNVPAAKKFYGRLLGWKTQPFGKGVPYTLFKKGREMAGGMLKHPHPERPSLWVPYVVVDDVDATVKKGVKLGAQLVLPPHNIPTVGRIAVLADPQGAVIGIFKPKM